MTDHTDPFYSTRTYYVVKLASGLYFNPFFGHQQDKADASKFWTMDEAEEVIAKHGGVAEVL